MDKSSFSFGHVAKSAFVHRFRIPPGSIMDGVVTLDKKESHHALAVLRVQPGEAVELLDGKGGVFHGVIASVERAGVQVSVLAQKASPPSSVRISLAVSVIKPERMELLIQKATELGVHSIIPLVTERTVVRLSPERWKGKAGRWGKIVQEACKQCGRGSAPEITDVVSFKNFLAEIARHDLTLLPTLAVPVKSIKAALDSAKKVESVLILIGPEGDFSKNEVEQAVLRGAKPVSLGPWIMRSETAAIHCLAIAQFYFQK